MSNEINNHELERQRAWVAYYIQCNADNALFAIHNCSLCVDTQTLLRYADEMLAEFDKRFSKDKV